MTVTPSTQRTWINYDSFDVGKNATVRFQQGPSNLTVNQVTGSKMSEIAGRIHVTDGAIVLMNRNGQIFRDGAILDGNIMVSTVPLNQQAFMNSGKLLFESAGLLGQKPRVTVGSVKASGLSVFIAPWFESLGLFTGNLHVFSGESVSLSLCGNTLARFEVQGALKDSLLHVAEGSQIEGQQVVLHTGHMEDVMDSAIKVDGSLKAQDIMVVGNEITLSETSSLDVSGETPGMLRVGVDGDYNHLDADAKRFPHVLAQNITIREGAKLLASSETGDAGTIYTFANTKGDYKGTYDVSSKMGAGGFLELSAHKNLVLPDIIDWRGTGGLGKQRGMMLLDPTAITITGNPAAIDNDGTNQGASPIATPLHDGTINTALGTGDVTVTASGTLNMLNAAIIAWTNGSNLTLTAPTMNINGQINMPTAFAPALNINASGILTIQAAGLINMQNAGSILNITSPNLIDGPGGIAQTTLNPAKIVVTGAGFYIGISSALLNGAPITAADYTIATTTPVNVPKTIDGSSVKPVEDNDTKQKALGKKLQDDGDKAEKYEDVVANYTKSVAAYKAGNDSKDAAIVSGKLGDAHTAVARATRDPKAKVEYCKKAIAAYKSAGQPELAKVVYALKGNAYRALAAATTDSATKAGHYKQAAADYTAAGQVNLAKSTYKLEATAYIGAAAGTKSTLVKNRYSMLAADAAADKLAV